MALSLDSIGPLSQWNHWTIESSPGFHARRLRKAWDAYARARVKVDAHRHQLIGRGREVYPQERVCHFLSRAVD